MSEITDIAADTVAERASWTTDPVKNLRTGKWFTAEIDGSPDALILATEFGEDARNMILLHVTHDLQAYAILDGDLVQFTLFGAVVKCRIVKRRDSGASPQTDFWAQQVSNKDA